MLPALDRLLEDVDVLPTNDMERRANVADASMVDSPKSTMWETSTAMVSGAAWVTMSNGLWGGGVFPTAYAVGVLILLGSSELTDYPIISTAWNVSEPFSRHAGNVTLERLSSPADSATEGVVSSAKFMAWRVDGLVIATFETWMLMIWVAKYLAKRTKSAVRPSVAVTPLPNQGQK